MHEIEAACERAAQRAQSEKLLAAMDLYQDAFMLVDTTVRKWRILHLNLMAANEIGAYHQLSGIVIVQCSSEVAKKLHPSPQAI